MRKWIILLAAVALIVAGWYLARTYWRFTPSWAEPKFGQVTRGDIRVPITAAGLIEPNERIEIKSEASGKVVEVRVKPGDYVRKGDVLLVLDPDDEQRNVDRARAARDRVMALLEQARVDVLTAEQNIEIAEAQVQELEATARSLEYDLNKARELFERGQGTEQELISMQSRFDVNSAQLRAARARAVNARHSLTSARENVKIQEASLSDAIKALEDAQERLNDTTIVAPQDGIITEVFVSVGNLVQSGTSGFSLGTRAMMMADISRLKVVARVDEADYGRVQAVAPIDALPQVEALRSAARQDAEQMQKRAGRVKLTVDAFPDEEFEGVIERVEPQGKLNAGSSIIQFDVYVEITDAKRGMLPLGTQAQVEFTVESVQDALLVPAEAVKSHEGEKGVWVRTPGSGPGQPWGKRFVPCRFGITDGASTQVAGTLGGAVLEPGMEVYTKLPQTSED